AVAFIFGSFARGGQRQASDVDLMVIAKTDALTMERISDALRSQQDRLGREVNPFVLSAREFRAKWLAKNHFIHRTAEGDKIFLIGDADELKRLAENWVVKEARNKPAGNRRVA